jgi:hypothetical protein
MTSTNLWGRMGTMALVLAAGAAIAAENTRPPAAIPTAQRPTATKSGTARGLLPDPILLDGSTHPAEKKSEYGMIGDFELPGDENAKNGKVGGGPQSPGQQNPNQAGGGPQMGLPQAGGAGGQQQAQQQSGKAGSQGGVEQKQGPQNANAAGNQIAGAGDPNAKPDGQQVAQLGGEGANQPPGAGEKPAQVAIGDSAMRIQTNAPSREVVGAQQQANANTQQHDKGTGSGGKGPTGTQGNNRVEKGRTIPAGL